MEKPDTGESWWSKIFGGGNKSSQTTPPPIITTKPSGGGTNLPTTGSGRFSTTYNRNDATMLKQLQEVYKYKSFIEEATRRYNFQSALICGIGSRESHWGLALKPPGPGGRGDFARRRPKGNRYTAEPPDGPGYGRGLMQIDYDWHEFARTGPWASPRENILYACEVLTEAKVFVEKNASLSADLKLRAILAAYNGGATNALRAIKAGQDVDANTTGKDYSRDVLSRSGWFQLHGWA